MENEKVGPFSTQFLDAREDLRFRLRIDGRRRFIEHGHVEKAFTEEAAGSALNKPTRCSLPWSNHSTIPGAAERIRTPSGSTHAINGTDERFRIE